MCSSDLRFSLMLRDVNRWIEEGRKDADAAATYKHFLLMNGDKIEADVAYTKLYKSAKKSIYIIDNYIGLKTLELLRATKDSVEVIIFSDNVRNKDMLTKNILNDFIRDYSNINLKMKIAGKKYHDRYIAMAAFYYCIVK